MKKVLLLIIMFTGIGSNLLCSSNHPLHIESIYKCLSTDKLVAIYTSFYENYGSVDSVVLKVVKYSLQNNLSPFVSLAVLDVENPKHDRYAIHKNDGKVISYDLGIFQINSRYIDYFVSKYWVLERNFKVFNEDDNIILAVAILKDYVNYFQNDSLAVMAYNAGISCVIHNEIPQSTLVYCKKFISNKRTMGVV